MKKIIQIIRFIANHPLASKRKLYFIGRFFKWQIAQSLFGYPVVYSFVEKSLLIVKKGMRGATGNIYTGLCDFSDMAFVLHALREEDIFGDIGANVGVFSILASVNAEAKSIAAEPVPQTFAYLLENIRINDAGDKITALQVGVADKPGELFFTRGMDTVNHVITAGEKNSNVPVVNVAVYTLDKIFEDNCPAIIKIDVEGFEWPVLQGGESIINDSRLKAVIIETNGSGERYGIRDEDIHLYFINKGFEPYQYDPFLRNITGLTHHGAYNTIYIKDPDWVKQRVASSRKYQICGLEV